jgi:hypothetical protein
MPKEIISENGTVRTTNAANRIPKTLLADEEFKNCRTHGTANKRPDAKQIRHTTIDPKNSMEATFDSNQLNLINSPFAGCPILSAVFSKKKCGKGGIARPSPRQFF